MHGYYTSWEERGIEIGLAQGLEQGLELGEVKSLKVVLEARFGPASTALFERLDALPWRKVETLLALAATVGSLREFTDRAFD